MSCPTCWRPIVVKDEFFQLSVSSKSLNITRLGVKRGRGRLLGDVEIQNEMIVISKLPNASQKPRGCLIGSPVPVASYDNITP